MGEDFGYDCLGYDKGQATDWLPVKEFVNVYVQAS
jgi:hypothetical protein